MNRPGWLLLFVAACGAQHVSSVDTDISVSSTRVDFGPFVVGGVTQRSLGLDNRSRIPETFTLSVGAPFAGPDTVTVAGGSREDVTLSFAPTAVGQVELVVKVGRFDVTLVGDGVAAQVCVSSGCQVSTLDPVTGACTVSAKADGEVCTSSDACITGGTCRAGACVGQARSCDDGNACTTDACARGSGCVHLDTSESCPAVSDPCHAAVCDPATGCGSAPVADGTPCGDVSCVVANVCMQGTCRQVVPPDGFSCQLGSPCQGAGRCEAQACVVPAKTTLEPKWTYASVGPRQMEFDGVADEQGSLYWLECSGGALTAQCDAVSYTATGLLRFRTPLPTTSYVRGGQLFDGGRFLFARGSVVFAVNGATGALEWSNGSPTGSIVTSLATTPGGGGLWVRELGDQGTVVDRGTLRRVNTFNGVTLGDLAAPRWDGLVVDANGTAWSTKVDARSGVLEAIDWSGAQVHVELMGSNVDAPRPQSVDATEVVLSDDDVYDVATAAQTHVGLAHPPVEGLYLIESLQLRDGRFRVKESVNFARVNMLVNSSYVLVAPLADNHAGPFATRDALLIATGGWGGFSIDLGTKQGAPRFSCTSSRNMAIMGGSVFTGRYFAVMTQCAVCAAFEAELQVYDLGDLGLPASGWVAPYGTPGHTNHAR